MSDKQLKTLRKKLKQDRDDALNAALISANGTGIASEAEGEFALERFAQLDRRLEALPKVPRIREPGPYDRNSPHSYILDKLAATSPMPVPGIDPRAAQARLAQHAQDVAVGRRAKDELAHRSAARRGVQVRDGGTIVRPDGSTKNVRTGDLSSATGSGGEFAPPAWLLDEVWTPVARGASPFLTLSPPTPLPQYGFELVLSRLAFGAVASQVENSTVAQDPGAPTDSLTSPVITLTGQATASQQWLDRGHSVDEVVATEAALSFAEAFQDQLTTGSGTGANLLGVMNVSTSSVDGIPGAINTSYTSASPTVAGLVTAIGQTIGQVADARRLMPEAIIMRGSRYAWIASEADSNGDPIQRPGTGLRPKDSSGPFGPFGPVAGLPVYTADAVPNDLGSGTDQDAVVVCRPSDFLLFCSEPSLDVWVEPDGANTMTVNIGWRVYCSAFVNQYPSNIGVLTGTGLVVPSGF